MILHHDRHHQAYVTNLNAALTSYADAATIADQVALLQNIKFNGGGHINHALFWRNLAPTTSEDAQNPEARAPKLAAAVAATYGSFDGLIDRFSAALNKVQGSGWGWLVRTSTPEGGLRIVTTKDQDPIVGDEVPIIGIDVWEHAYYLQVCTSLKFSGRKLISPRQVHECSAQVYRRHVVCHQLDRG
jgi:Fe-Mn family superoxide dismutase